MPPFVDRAECLRPLVGGIIGLVAAHVVTGVTLGACFRLFSYDPDSVVGTLFMGLAFAQAGLVGLWALEARATCRPTALT